MDHRARRPGRIVGPLLRREAVITETNLDMPLVGRGKVRDIYSCEVLPSALLMVSTDRLSAFDCVFREGIPGKGRVLNQLSAFWFRITEWIIPNHFISTYTDPKLGWLEGRAMLVCRATPLKVEAVVRGYLAGSGLKEYRESGTLWGNPLPSGLKEGSRLAEPMVTPTTKAEKGHDLPMSRIELRESLGDVNATMVERKSLALYRFAHEFLLRKGLVLADTKFEFGLLPDGSMVLIDEVLTPDSSRYWLKTEYDDGRLVNMDKQFVRNYLELMGWNKKPPVPPLPDVVIEQAAEIYRRVREMITA